MKWMKWIFNFLDVFTHSQYLLTLVFYKYIAIHFGQEFVWVGYKNGSQLGVVTLLNLDKFSTFVVGLCYYFLGLVTQIQQNLSH